MKQLSGANSDHQQGIWLPNKISTGFYYPSFRYQCLLSYSTPKASCMPCFEIFYHKTQHHAICWRKVAHVECLRSYLTVLRYYQDQTYLTWVANLLCRTPISWRHHKIWLCDHRTYKRNMSVAGNICRNCCGDFPRRSKCKTGQFEYDSH